MDGRVINNSNFQLLWQCIISLLQILTQGLKLRGRIREKLRHPLRVPDSRRIRKANVLNSDSRDVRCNLSSLMSKDITTPEVSLPSQCVPHFSAVNAG